MAAAVCSNEGGGGWGGAQGRDGTDGVASLMFLSVQQTATRGASPGHRSDEDEYD